MSHDDALTAVQAADVDAVRSALAADPSLVRARGEHQVTLLHRAVEVEDPDMTRLLIERGADVEAEADWGHTPLAWAATLGSSRSAAVLIEAGARPGSPWVAAGLGLLGEVPADTDAATLDHAFYLACRNGHRAVAELLLDHGADVDARGYFDAPAIHWAAMKGHGMVVDRLLDRGADPTLRDPEFDGDAASWAREGGHEELARRLEGGRS